MGDRRCCCAEICLIQSNDLDSDKDLTGNFTLSDGEYFSYHEAPFEAIQVSNASETATASTPHPQSPYPPRVQIEFYGDQLSSQPRVILGGKIVAQVTIGDDCSQLDILNEADDSEICQTLWMPGIDRNEWHRLIVCYDPDTGIVKATVTDLTTSQTYDLSCEYSGDALDATAAFGTGPDHVDNVYVRNFRFWRLWYCGEPPYTSDCHILGDAWDYYYELPTRQYCYTCNTSCVIVSTDFSEVDDGDMPCDWDAGATDWAVASGQATGNGEVCHKWDGTGGSYNVSATFDLGHLETQGDSVTVSLTSGDVTHSLTVTRVAGANPGDPDRLKYEWEPDGFADSYAALTDGSVTLRIGPHIICNSLTSTSVATTVTAGSFCVSITQPTMAGHTDAGMTAFSIIKSKEMDENCDESPCTTECLACKDGIWPASWMVEVEGIESYCCDISDINKAYYANEYAGLQCHSWGWGDDGLGVSTEDDLWKVVNACANSGEVIDGYMWGAGFTLIGTDTDSLPDHISEDIPSEYNHSVDGSIIYSPIRIDVYVSEYTGSPRPALPYTITVTVHRLFFRTINPINYCGTVAATYSKSYAEIPDCANLSDEELPCVSVSTFSTVQYLDGTDWKCSGDASPPGYFSPWGTYLGPTYQFTSGSIVKLTAL